MTKTQFMRKYRELANQAHARLLEKGEAALRSGAIDLEAFGNDYELPKIVVKSALKMSADEYITLSPEAERHVKNLACFI